MTAGQEFVKKLKPFGCALFIVAAIAVIAICLTSGHDPIKGYEPPETTEYYSQHPEELVQELEENIFPYLDGVDSCRVTEDSLVEICIREDDFAVTRSAVLYYFDSSLFIFTQT